MRKHIADQFELPGTVEAFNLAGQTAIDGEAEQKRLDAERQAKEDNDARQIDLVRCPDHRNGGATSCPRGGAALQIWQRKQWGE